MKSDFNSLGISPPILKAIEEMGFESPTEVQAKAIPHVLNQEDVIVISKTGSGKTAVFGVPLLQMMDPAQPGPQGLILTPTRELAVQVDGDLNRMAKHLPHKTTAVYGQHSMNVEIQALSKGVSIVTGTPGRVEDHIRHGKLKTKNIRFLVLDEADRMLDMGFFDQVVGIVKTLPRDRVTLLFSATIPPEVRRICLDYMKKPVTVEIASQTKTVETTEQAYYRVIPKEKTSSLSRLLLLERPESCVIFCNQRNTVDKVQSFLDRKGYASRALHGDIPQVKRSKTIQQFKQGAFHILVATDVAARGIHVDDLSLVINYDLPLEKDGYIHRIGRTGRSGAGGRAVTLVTGDDIMGLYEIEEYIGAMIEEAEFPSGSPSDEEKALIDQWLASNAEKRQLLNAAGEPGSAQPQHRHPQPKGQPHREKQQGPPPRRDGDQPKKAQPSDTGRAADSARPKQTSGGGKPRYDQPRPMQQPAPAPAAKVSEPAAAQPKTNPEIIKTQVAETKKTFFQRVFQRIRGQHRKV